MSDAHDPLRPTQPDGFASTHAPYPSFADTAVNAVAQQRPPGALGPEDGAFDVCHPGLALRALLYVQAVVGTGVLLWSPQGDLLPVLGPAVFTGLTATLAWLTLVCGARRLLVRLSPTARGSAVTALGAASALGGSALLLPVLGDPVTAQRWLAVALAGVLLSGSLWVWLTLRVRSRLPAEAAARLVELQSRIRPHFLFNALNTAVALVRVDPARAEAVLEDLAQLFRTALEDHGQVVTLAEEIELAQRYLAIEQVRFGERMRVQWQLDPAAGAAKVPPLLLQPLVENAVRHAVEPSPEGADIVVRTRVQRGQALVDITNTLPAQGGRPGHGIALQNVRERLLLLHDVAARFEVQREAHRYRVLIEVPL